ncbi:MAG TPA: hypothetical protein VEL07_12820 [Planctomycetota bacterium]|nr:hypothetical protein [Planctomycetota bacterium]
MRLLLLLVSLSVPGSPHAAEAIRIMPLGDSITQGNTQQDSYRRPLWHKLAAAGYHVDFVGSEKTNFTGAAAHPDFDQDNEGHYGWTIPGILERLDGWLAQNVPDVVLLHLGTNGNESGIEKAAGLERVIATLRAQPEGGGAAGPAVHRRRGQRAHPRAREEAGDRGVADHRRGSGDRLGMAGGRRYRRRMPPERTRRGEDGDAVVRRVDDRAAEAGCRREDAREEEVGRLSRRDPWTIARFNATRRTP